MKRWMWGLCLCLVCCWTLVGAAMGPMPMEAAPLDEGAFCDAYLDALQKAVPEMDFELTGAFTVTATWPDGEQAQLNLENAYAEYLSGAGDAEQVISHYVAGILPALTGETPELTREAIVPVLKDQAYLDYVLGLGLDVAYEELLEGLYIIYMLDTPTAVRAAAWEEIEDLGIGREELRALAVQNLVDLLPPVQMTEYEGLIVLSADGMYDASVILTGLPTATDLGFSGGVAIGVPARDLLVLGDTEDAAAMTLLRGLVGQVYSQSGYPIADRVLLAEGDGFVWLDEAAQ